MNVLVIGQGGREHAMALALAKSPSTEKVFAIPGSRGMEPQIQVAMEIEPHVENILEFCQQNNIKMVLIGPEKFLVEGLVDDLRRAGLIVFGPDKKASQLEGSKIYAKNFMKKHQVPTSPFRKVQSTEEVIKAMPDFTPPFVLKADGLASGKGVFICENKEQLMEISDKLFNQGLLASSGEIAVLEQFQQGYELSFFILTNGYDYIPLPMVQDHKKLHEGNKGPNTGGMGAIAPITASPTAYNLIIKSIVEPTIKGIQKEDFIYWGVVFIGIMMTDGGPLVLEYNVRFGDPEAQVLMPLLKGGDWAEAFFQVGQGQIPPLEWNNLSSACVVLASENYPSAPVKGTVIEGTLSSSRNQYLIHAGTEFKEGQWRTNGGRVLNVIGIGETRAEAVQRAYEKARTISWPGMQYRKDIGHQ